MVLSLGLDPKCTNVEVLEFANTFTIHHGLGRTAVSVQPVHDCVAQPFQCHLDNSAVHHDRSSSIEFCFTAAGSLHTLSPSEAVEWNIIQVNSSTSHGSPGFLAGTKVGVGVHVHHDNTLLRILWLLHDDAKVAVPFQVPDQLDQSPPIELRRFSQTP